MDRKNFRSISLKKAKWEISQNKAKWEIKMINLGEGNFGQKGWEFIDGSKILRSPPPKIGGKKSFNPYMLSLHK